MKILKITLLATLFFASITSCTKQDLTEDDIQTNPETEIQAPITGGGVDD